MPVSIVVLYYNKIHLTRACLDSIISNYGASVSVFAYDNGSLPEITGQLKQEYPNVLFKRSEKNRGYSGGFNRALQWVFSEGVEKVLFLTNDTSLMEGALECLNQFSITNHCSLIAPLLLSHRDLSLVDSYGAKFDPKTYSLSHFKEIEGDFILGENEYIPGTALYIDKKVFHLIGGCDESYFMYWEDVDFCFRARSRGIRMGRCAQARISHGIGKTCHKKAIYTTYYFQRNRIKFCKTFLNNPDWMHARIQFRDEIEDKIEFYKLKQDFKRMHFWMDIGKEFALLKK
jgi:GT2 family glycosyltransferase